MWSDLSQEVFEGPQNTMWKILGKENNTILRLLIFSFFTLVLMTRTFLRFLNLSPTIDRKSTLVYSTSQVIYGSSRHRQFCWLITRAFVKAVNHFTPRSCW